METLVATVLIVIIFMITSMLLNSMFANSLRYNTHWVGAHLYELQYRYQNNSLQTPYTEDLDAWEISVFQEQRDGIDLVVFEATNTLSKKSLTKSMVNEK